MSEISSSSLPPATEMTAQVTEGRFKRVLGTPSLVLFGLVYMVPLTVFTTYGIVTSLTGGRVADAYIITLVVMLFTARSYARMSMAMPYSGSAYVYTQQSMGGAVGFLVGWALLLDYLFLPLVIWLIGGSYLQGQFPGVPFFVWILAFIVITSALNVIGLKVAERTNLILMTVQLLILALFVILSVAHLIHGSQSVVSTTPFVGGTGFSVGGIVPGASFNFDGPKDVRLWLQKLSRDAEAR